MRPGGGFEPALDYMFEKVEINGENEIPLYTFLKGACGPTFTQFSRSEKLFYEPLRVGDIAWNFEKFLIDRDGRPHTRWHPHVVDPLEMGEDIAGVMTKASVYDERQHEQQMPPVEKIRSMAFAQQEVDVPVLEQQFSDIEQTALPSNIFERHPRK